MHFLQRCYLIVSSLSSESVLGLTVVFSWLTAEYLKLILDSIDSHHLLLIPHQMHLHLEKVVSVTVLLIYVKFYPDIVV